MKHVEVDVSDPKSVQEAWGRVVEMFPGIDCVINNAGLMQPLNFNVDGARSSPDPRRGLHAFTATSSCWKAQGLLSEAG